MSLKRAFLGKRGDQLEALLNGEDPETVPFAELKQQTTFRAIVAIIRRDPLAMFSLIIIGLLLFMAVAAPYIAPYPQDGEGRTRVDDRLLQPNDQYLLGTDNLGRDILSRIIYGARPAMVSSLVVVGLAILIGLPLGAISGYFGGWIDEVIMRITDLFLAFPPLLLAMTIVALLGPSLIHAVLALVITWWTWYTRLVRTVTLTLKNEYFVDAARSMGIPSWVIIYRHIIPNTLTPVIVQASIDIGTVILLSNALAFIGLGSQPPQADWGLMIEDGRQYLQTHWVFSTAPGVILFIAVLAFNLLGDTLRDIFDPRQYQ